MGQKSSPSSLHASSTSFPTSIPHKGELDEGLSRITFDDARAGETLCATRLTGKFHGVMPRIKPIGNLLTIPILYSEPLSKTSGSTSPIIRGASSAPSRKVRTTLSISTFEN